MCLRRLGTSTCFEHCTTSPSTQSSPFTLDAPRLGQETAHIIARLSNDDVNVDVIGEAPVNPSLCVAEYASNIDEVIDWFQKDTAPAVLIPCNHFGPDVLVRCHSSPPGESVPVRDVLLMGQYKSCTSGNNESLDAGTTVKALTSASEPLVQKGGMLFSFIIDLISLKIWQPQYKRQRLIAAIENFHVLRFIAGYPLLPNLNLRAKSVQHAIQELGPNLALASFQLDTFRGMFNSEDEARNVLAPMDAALDRKRKADEINN